MGMESLLSLQNPGIPYDPAWIDLAPQTASFDQDEPSGQIDPEEIKLVASVFDLTSLGSDDTQSLILGLFEDALDPLPGLGVIVAGVCVYPQFLSLAGTWLRERGVRLVTVAGSFPHGLGSIESRCSDVTACAKIADEVDFPIDRRLAIEGKWEELYWETKEMVRAARGVPTKVILATGELHDQPSIYRASTVAMMAGASFIKTSTGKERVNATIDAGVMMCRAIKDYQKRTEIKVGLKAAGGIRTTREAVTWLHMLRARLGEEWVSPSLFRIGASALLGHLRHSLEYHN